MISGIFSAEFTSNQNMVGRGIAVFADNAFHGGDAFYYYKGKYRMEGNSTIVATVDVVNHAGIPSSVFGQLPTFRLDLNGVVNDQSLTLTGQVEEHPNLRIELILKKLDDLVEA